MAHTKMVLNYMGMSMDITKSFSNVAINLESNPDFTDSDCINELEKISKDLSSLKSCIDHQIKCAKQHKYL